MVILLLYYSERDKIHREAINLQECLNKIHQVIIEQGMSQLLRNIICYLLMDKQEIHGIFTQKSIRQTKTNLSDKLVLRK